MNNARRRERRVMVPTTGSPGKESGLPASCFFFMVQPIALWRSTTEWISLLFNSPRLYFNVPVYFRFEKSATHKHSRQCLRFVNGAFGAPVFSVSICVCVCMCVYWGSDPQSAATSYAVSRMVIDYFPCRDSIPFQFSLMHPVPPAMAGRDRFLSIEIAPSLELALFQSWPTDGTFHILLLIGIMQDPLSKCPPSRIHPPRAVCTLGESFL